MLLWLFLRHQSTRQLNLLMVRAFIFYLVVLLTSSSGRIRLDGTCRYLAACDVLGPFGVAIHKLLRVLICLDCFLPDDMPGHLKEHGFKVLDRAGFLTACARWHLHGNYSDVLHPAPRGPPVEVLTRYTGYACAVDPVHCAYACRSKEWMEKQRRLHKELPAIPSSRY